MDQLIPGMAILVTTLLRYAQSFHDQHTMIADDRAIVFQEMPAPVYNAVPHPVDIFQPFANDVQYGYIPYMESTAMTHQMGCPALIEETARTERAHIAELHNPAAEMVRT